VAGPRPEALHLDWFDKEFVLVAGPLGQEWLEAGRRASETLRLPLGLQTMPRVDHADGFRMGMRGACLVRPDGHVPGACLDPGRPGPRGGGGDADGAARRDARRVIRHAALPSGIGIAYEATGSGPPLLMMHGGEADHTQYDGFVPHLAPRFACIAYDQRDSGGTRNPDADFGVEDLADDAAALIAALGHARAHVFGSSLGSVIAQALAVRHPGAVDRLVLSAAIRIGRSIAEVAPETDAALRALRADPARNAAEIARYFYPDEHLARHPHLAQRFAAAAAARRSGRGARR
jgi:hypothetical protein